MLNPIQYCNHLSSVPCKVLLTQNSSNSNIWAEKGTALARTKALTPKVFKAICYLNSNNDLSQEKKIKKSKIVIKYLISEKIKNLPIIPKNSESLNKTEKELLKVCKKLGIKDQYCESYVHDQIQKQLENYSENDPYLKFNETKTTFSVPDQYKDLTLACAIINKNLEQLIQLITFNPSVVNEQTKQKGITPLHLACINNQLEMVEFLIQKGANINESDLNGMTPLHLASFKGQEAIVEFLLNHGAEINQPDLDGDTPLHLATSKGQEAIVELLLKNGAQINQPNLNGDTPLHLATSKGQEAIVELLLKNGGKIQIFNRNTSTPYGLAILNNEFSKKLMERLCEIDNGFTNECFSQMMLANRFSLSNPSVKGKIGKKKFKILGTSIPFALQSLISKIGPYYEQLSEEIKNDHKNGKWQKILEKLPDEALLKVKKNPQAILNVLVEAKKIIKQSENNKNLLTNKIINKIQNREVTAFFGEWPGHAVAWGYIRKGTTYYFFRCNKGDGVSKDLPSGIHIHKIGKPDMIPTVVEKFKDDDLVQDLFLNQVDSLLDLKSKFYIEQSPQKTDNCTIANSHSMELAVLFALLNPIFRSEALVIARAIKNSRKEDTRIGDLKDYLASHDPQGKNDLWPVNMNLINEIYSKCSKSKSKEAGIICCLIDEWKHKTYIPQALKKIISSHERIFKLIQKIGKK